MELRGRNFGGRRSGGLRNVWVERRAPWNERRREGYRRENAIIGAMIFVVARVSGLGREELPSFPVPAISDVSQAGPPLVGVELTI